MKSLPNFAEHHENRPTLPSESSLMSLNVSWQKFNFLKSRLQLSLTSCLNNRGIEKNEVSTLAATFDFSRFEASRGVSPPPSTENTQKRWVGVIK